MGKENLCLNLDDEIYNDHIDDVQTELNISNLKSQSLKGIWKDAGFEKIVDLEGEIYKIRQELQDSILKKVL